jgi:cyclopropane-fatty-acyl-phospholipid synthase
MAQSLLQGHFGVPADGSWIDRLKRSAERRLWLHEIPVRIELAGGLALNDRHPAPIATIRLRDHGALLRLLIDPEYGFGETFSSGQLEVEGDLVGLLEEIYRASARHERSPRFLWSDRGDGSPTRARRDIHRHYDLGNDFYELWLDRDMVYTCAFFPTDALALEDAQRAKMDLVCAKLRLQPGESVVEAGCGWGSLAIHMAQRCGVTVRAFNISHEQIRYARERAVRAGVGDRVEFVEDDYRNVTGSCDVFVSVGMLEHVGRHHFGDLAAVLDRTLGDHGRGLLHFIGRNRPRPLSTWIRRNIFPGGYPPTLAEVCRDVLQPPNLSVLDVENLRLHYARTLKDWRERFERHEGTVADRYGERFARAWRLYLAGSEAAFTTGWLQLFQIVFARGDTNRVHSTRGGSEIGYARP